MSDAGGGSSGGGGAGEKHHRWRTARIVERLNRRRTRRWGRVALLGGLLVFSLYLLATRSFITRRVVVPALGSALNLEVTASSVSVSPWGELVMDDAVFRAPGVPGPAGQIARVKRATAQVDWWAAASGGGAAGLRSLELDGATLILSQSTDDRSLNVAALARSASPGKAASRVTLPTIVFHDAAIEVGEHQGARYTTLKRVTMNGRVTPSADGPGTYDVEFRQSGGAGGPLRLVGRIAPGDISGTVTNFSLAEWSGQAVPSPVRRQMEDLSLAGDVTTATFRYTDDQGLVARLRLRGVAMNLPVEPDPTFAAAPGPVFGPPTRQMRMRGVEGEIALSRGGMSADLSGTIEDLPYRVKLDYGGTTLEAPFRMEVTSNDFRVDRNPALLPFAPEKVRVWVRTFSTPTASISARVVVTRGAPSGQEPGAIGVEGVVDVRNGTAAFERFPYAFQEMSGRFEFDSNSLRIVNLTGRSASGAAMLTNARIEPLDETSEIDVRVQVRGAPIDKAMERAFGTGRANFIAALFSRRRYQDLVAAGLVRTPADAQAEERELASLRAAAATTPPAEREAARARLARLEARSLVPVFEVGGRADVDVTVFSPRGAGMPWQTTVDVRIAEAGVLPEKFPLPVRARGLVAQVKDEDGRLLAGEFLGLPGGRATVDATFKIPRRDDPTGEADPRIVIRADGLPLDALAIAALPGTEPVPGLGPDPEPRISVKRVLRDLRIDARLGGEVRVANRTDEPESPLGFDADLSFTGARLAPPPFEGDPAVIGTGLTGRVVASERRVEVDVSGQLRGPAAQGPAEQELTDGPQCNTLSARVTYQSGEGDAPGRALADVRVEPLDLSTPMQSLVWVFSRDAAKAVRDLVSGYGAQGLATLALTADVADGAGASPALTAELRPRTPWTFRLAGDDIEWEALRNDDAVVRLRRDASGPVRIELPALAGRVRGGGGGRAGTLTLDGVVPLGVSGGAGTLRAGLVEVDAGSPLVLRGLEQGLSADVARRVRDLKPRGSFDADVVMDFPAAGAGAAARPSPRVTGSVRPKSLWVEVGGATIAAPRMAGSVEFEPGSGVVRALQAAGDDWDLRLDGGWTLPEGGPFTLRANAGGRAARISPELLGALPPEARALVETLGLKVDGRLTLDDGSITVERGGPESLDVVRASGHVGFTGAAIDPGVPITDASGSARFELEAPARGPTPYQVRLAGERLRINGVEATGVTALVRGGAGDGLVTVEEVEGRVHGGRAVARVELRPEGAGRAYDADVRLSGVRFRPVIDDLSGTVASGPPDTERELSRGVLDAHLLLSGRAGDQGSRRGRGEVSVARRGARVLDLPVLIRLIEVSNLRLPLGEALDAASARFYVDGPVVGFTEVSAHSPSVSLIGQGTMTLPDQQLDLRFTSRAARRIWGLSSLVEGLRDELVSAQVRGTAEKPEVKLVQFEGTRRMLGRSVGGAAGSSAARPGDPAEASDRQPGASRIRPSGEGAGR